MQSSRVSLTVEQDDTIAYYSGYTEEEIQPLFELLLDYCTGDVKHEAFNTKYASKRYLKGKLQHTIASPS